MFECFQRITLQSQIAADLEDAEMNAHLCELAAEENGAKAMMYRARALRLRTDLGNYVGTLKMSWKTSEGARDETV